MGVQKLDINRIRTDRSFRRRCLVSLAMGCLLMALYFIIFFFSAQDGEESGSVSREVSKKCIEVADTISGRQWTDDFKEMLVSQIEHFVRKTAHFSEYACMGILVYTLWRQWMKKGRGLYTLTVLWVFVSAAGDEFHQYFTPERYASPTDVLLDTCGGIFGMLLCILFERVYARWHHPVT